MTSYLEILKSKRSPWKHTHYAVNVVPSQFSNSGAFPMVTNELNTKKEKKKVINVFYLWAPHPQIFQFFHGPSSLQLILKSRTAVIFFSPNFPEPKYRRKKKSKAS